MEQGVSDEKYQCWKSEMSISYNWFAYHRLFRGSQSCRWGPQISQRENENVQRLYLAEQAEQGVDSSSNNLIIANCYIMKPGVAATEDISKFNEKKQSPSVKQYKTMIHPGEVSRIRELPQKSNIVATITDFPDVYIWDVDTQPDCPVASFATNHPNVILTGHTEDLVHALAMCLTEPFVLSGAKDKAVILWSIEDCMTSLGLELRSMSQVLRPRGEFKGHGATVQDVQFCPSSAQEFCSVGSDSCLMLWDARSGNAPAVRVEKAHDAAVYCVDWNKNDVNHILTASADHTVHMFDRRNLTAGGVGSPIHKFEDHKSPVQSIQWCPDRSSVFAAAYTDGILNIWDHDKVPEINNNADAQRKLEYSAGLFFQHFGHRDTIVDFHWNPYDPWTIASVSIETSRGSSGGTLQIWRLSDKMCRFQKEVIAEPSHFKEHLQTCSAPVKSEKSKSAVVRQLVESKKYCLMRF